MRALLGGARYYHEPMAGFSIPAAEHSTITSWGRDGEVEAYRNMLRHRRRWSYFVCGPPGMADTVEAALIELGIPRGAVRVERFALA